MHSWIYRVRNGFGRCQEGNNIYLGFTISFISKETSSLESMCLPVLFYTDYFMLHKVAIAFLKSFILGTVAHYCSGKREHTKRRRIEERGETNPTEQHAQRRDESQDLGSWPELKVFPHPPMRMA